MNPISKILNTYPLIILDGAFSTELERRGCNINDSLWSAKILMENPHIIGEVHKDYLTKGADCIITSSYQATYEGFIKRGLSKIEASNLIQLSVSLATKVRNDFWSKEENRTSRPKPLVAASIGPYGAYLADGSEYRGGYKLDENQLMDFHRERMKTLIDAKPDILACETIPCLSEAVAIAKLLKEFPGIYGWISFSAKDEKYINNGELIKDCAKVLDEYEQVAAIGINCTAPEYVTGLIEEIKKGTTKPIIVYPNSGENYNPLTKTWNGCSGNWSYANSAKEWHKHGASIIGGCCRTTPKDIQDIARLMR
jgi:homocysteine S-methyltransferase